MIDVDLEGLRTAAGIGVAGNFAGHLEQAGEAADFTSVSAAPDAPKGVFPWYLPGAEGFLGVFPLATDHVAEPAPDAPGDLQIEPEAGALCRVAYDRAGVVTGLAPFALGAFNDCSIRRPGAPKISHKKNWGPASKGIAPHLMEVADLEPDGALRTLRLACFLRRDGTARAYGVDSPLAGYSYAGTRLLDWLVERLGAQTGGPGSPLEDVGAQLREAGCPEVVVVGVGATRYTPLGETSYLRDGDESIVVVYDGATVSPARVEAAVAVGEEDTLPAASVLRQPVRPGS